MYQPCLPMETQPFLADIHHHKDWIERFQPLSFHNVQQCGNQIVDKIADEATPAVVLNLMLPDADYSRQHQKKTVTICSESLELPSTPIFCFLLSPSIPLLVLLPATKNSLHSHTKLRIEPRSIHAHETTAIHAASDLLNSITKHRVILEYRQ